MRRAGFGRNVQFVTVPAMGPRTKPKALNYALPLARGDYLVIYDNLVNGKNRSIDGRISRLRKKLKDNPLSPTRIKTVWGKGYLLAQGRSSQRLIRVPGGT